MQSIEVQLASKIRGNLAVKRALLQFHPPIAILGHSQDQNKDSTCRACTPIIESFFHGLLY